MNTLKSILVAVDLDESSANYVLESARQIAPETPIEVVHVLERSTYYNFGDPSGALIEDLQGRMAREINDYLAKLCSRHGIARSKLLEGHPATAIQQHAEAEGHDLIVLGTNGRHGIKRLLGSTANAPPITRDHPCGFFLPHDSQPESSGTTDPGSTVNRRRVTHRAWL